MNDLPKLYFTMERYLFPLLEEELGELTAKMREFLRIVEVVRPSRFITSALRWCGLGRPMKDREKMLRAFFLKAVYDLPTTKALIENLKTNPSLRRLCGWESRCEVPSEATFSRAFKVFAEEKVPDAVHAMIVKENYTGKLVGHASIDSTAIVGREKACRKNTPKIKLKKKRGRKSKAEKAALAEQELSETSFWCGYKLHLSLGDGGVPLAALLSSASMHDSQAAIPLMQMASERATILYDLADSAYDAEEIRAFSEKLGHVPVIDPNPRRGDKVELAPARKIRYRERSTVERGNSDLKDNYGARHVRVKGHWKVLCHLMFGVIAITVKQLFNMLE